MLTALRDEATALIDLLDASTRDRRVPACPDWDLAQLVAHAGSAHRWVSRVVLGGTRPQLRVLFDAPTELDARLAWCREALDLVLTTLDETPADTEVWHVAGGTVGSWWWRRKALVETAIHRWDGDSALDGPPRLIAPDVAVAGIEEHAQDFLPGMLHQARDRRPHGTVLMVPTDADRSFVIDLEGGRTVLRDGTTGDLRLEGTASDLLLWMWNRPTTGLTAAGDLSITEAWKGLAI